MRCALIIFDNMTMLDLVGFYDPLTRLKSMGFVSDLKIDLCGSAWTHEDDRGLRLQATAVMPDLTQYDLIYAPGGWGTRKLREEPVFIDWLRQGEPVHWKISACTGSLLLGAAGFLKGRQATTHPRAVDLLAPYCEEVIDQRIVHDGQVVTAGGVTAAIDLGLYMCEEIGGSAAAQTIALQMDYPYYQPAHLA